MSFGRTADRRRQAAKGHLRTEHACPRCGRKIFGNAYGNHKHACKAKDELLDKKTRNPLRDPRPGDIVRLFAATTQGHIDVHVEGRSGNAVTSQSEAGYLTRTLREWQKAMRGASVIVTASELPQAGEKGRRKDRMSDRMSKAELLRLDKLLAKFQKHCDTFSPLDPSFERAANVRRDIDRQINRKEYKRA